MIVNATSLGGVTSVMESRARWEGDRVPAGLLRLSVGLEDPEALWADLAPALDSLGLRTRPVHSVGRLAYASDRLSRLLNGARFNGTLRSA